MSDINFKTLKDEDLTKELSERREELRKMRFNVAGTKGLKANPGKLRKDIARIMTELKARNK